MHKYLQSIGFSDIKNKKELKEILTDVVMTSSERSYTEFDEDTRVAIMSKNISPSLGISVCGEFDEEGHFVYDYYFPYLRSYVKSIQEEITVERHSSQISFAGVCEEINFGVIVIFYLQNFTDYFEADKKDELKNSYISLCGLSSKGHILLPLQKSSIEKRSQKMYYEKRKSSP